MPADVPESIVKCDNCTAIVLWDTKKEGDECIHCNKPIRPAVDKPETAGAL
ncbi:hypothetical protein [Streptomyces sp. NPDC055189]